MAKPFVQIENLSKSYGDSFLFRQISFSIMPQQRIALIAPNGAGKTTLLNIIAGLDVPDEGRVVWGNDISFSYLRQIPVFPSNLSIMQVCMSASAKLSQAQLDYHTARNSHDATLLQTATDSMDALKAWDCERRIEAILSRLKIENTEEKIANLSGGQIKRVALANALIAEPDLLILDEPTNHLDLAMIEWLENYLQRSAMSLLMVTHDRYFLDHIATEIIEIADRQLYSYKGNYDYYLEKQEERTVAQNSELLRTRNLLRREREWMRRQPQARATKAKARIDAYYDLEEKARNNSSMQTMNLARQKVYIGSKIFEAHNLSKRFGEKIIIDDFNYKFARFDKMGIVGENGSGKTTFLRLVAGELTPDSGYIDTGETVRFGYFRQSGIEFKPDMKVIDVINEVAETVEMPDGERINASRFLSLFQFPYPRQNDFVAKLSGGERQRLHLCRILMTNPNFLLLDEPTNDLDIISLNILEEYLIDFKGCLIVVSHDRYFMDKVINHLLVFEGDARIRDFAGNYTQYRQWKLQQEANTKIISPPLEKRTSVSAKNLAPPAKKRLSFAEKQELERLDTDIPHLEAEHSQLERELSSGKLSTEELLAKSQRIAQLISLLDEKSTRWLELNE